ncbi:hypothetical protein FKP32DRAFT_504059 [Trametes sanguinea]|nr:hypothetical protein FKP32DRAFT_504059 [Trametes sanguinea]
MHQTDQHAESSAGTHHAQHAASSSASDSQSTMTALSLGRLGSRPDDIVMHVDWERRTTTVTLSYHHGRNRPPQHVVFPGAALPNQNDILTNAGDIATSPTHNINTVNNDAAAQTTVGLGQTPDRNASPCERGCQERGVPASPPSSPRRDRIPVPQLDLPAPDRRLSDIGLSDLGIATTSTTATASTSTPRSIPPLPRRNRPSVPAAVTTTSANAVPTSSPPAIPRSPSSAAAPPTNSHVQPRDAPATPSTSSRPPMPTSSSSSSSPVKIEKSPAKKEKKPSARDDTSRPGLPRKRDLSSLLGPPSSKILRPYRQSRKIRSTKSYTTWYGPTESSGPLPAPPDILSPCHAFLYVHKHARGTQVWMFHSARRTAMLSSSASSASCQGEGPAGVAPETRREPDAEPVKGKGRWKLVYPGFPHPDLAGYVLHLLDDGQPRWVKEASAKTYAGGQRRRQRMARYM